MQNKEYQQSITAKEAIFRITSAIEKQKKAEGKDDGLNKLTPLMINALDVFGVGDVPIERTIFTNDSWHVTVIDSFDKLPEETRKWLMPDGLLRYGEQEKTLLEILNITSKKNPVTKKLLLNILYKGDSEDKGRNNEANLNNLINFGKKEIKAKGQAIMSGIRTVRNKGEESKESVYWLDNVDNYRCEEGNTEMERTLVFLRAASKEKPISYIFLAKEILGEATFTNVTHIRNIFVKLENILEKSEEVIERVHLDKELGKPKGPKQLGFYIAKKGSQATESSSVKKESTLKANQARPSVVPASPAPFSKPKVTAPKSTKDVLLISGTSVIRTKPIDVKANQPNKINSSENSSNKSLALSTAQTAALAIILRGPVYKSTLQKYRINIESGQINAIHTILATYRQKDIGDKLNTQAFLKESFLKLAQYFKEFMGSRDELLDRNTVEEAKTLIKMIPAQITVDNLRLLMDEIGAIINANFS